jgi:DNA polymerase-3 subunit epsilon
MTGGDPSAAFGAYLDCFRHTWSDDTPIEQVRFAVLDCETTGLEPKHHRIVSIGAIAVTECQIDLGDGFEALLRVRHNTAATLVHGITRDAARAGVSELDAMVSLLGYLRDAVIVGHHVRYDLAMIDAALTRQLGVCLSNRRCDTAGLALLLEQDGAFSDGPALADLSLDGLCERFGVVPYDRHTAAGDAFLTAQILLRLLRAARHHGRGTLGMLLQTPDETSPEQ